MITVISSLILGSIVCIHLYTPFWIMIIDLDILENLNCHLFLVIFFVFTFLISSTYHTGQLFLLANQRLPFILLVDIGYSVVYFSVCVCTRSDFLLCSSEMCITPSTAVPSRIYSPELLRKVNSDQSFPIPRDVRKNYFDYVFGVPGINIFNTQHPKPSTPENVNV